MKHSTVKRVTGVAALAVCTLTLASACASSTGSAGSTNSQQQQQPGCWRSFGQQWRCRRRRQEVGHRSE